MQCLGLTGACAACSHCKVQTARPRHGSCQTLITLTRRSLSVSRALHVLSSCVLCAWRRLLLICWKLLIGVCVRDGLAASVCVYRTFAASVELRPRGWRAVAFPRWLHLRDQDDSTWLIVILIVRCCFGGLCVRDGLGACCLFAHVALLLLPLSLFLGVRAPSLSLDGFRF